MQVEVLSVLTSVLEGLELTDFYVDVGSLEVWRRVSTGIEEYQDQLFTSLRQRNFDLVQDLPIADGKKEQIWDLFNYRGKDCDYKKLNRIINGLSAEQVMIDFGTIRPLPYYEDIIFEVYSPRLSQPLGAGGDYRHDGFKACGFAFDLQLLMELYAVMGIVPEPLLQVT